MNANSKKNRQQSFQINHCLVEFPGPYFKTKFVLSDILDIMIVSFDNMIMKLCCIQGGLVFVCGSKDVSFDNMIMTLCCIQGGLVSVCGSKDVSFDNMIMKLCCKQGGLVFVCCIF